MNKYLLAILKEINTIIIPGLGALTITNADTGEIMFMPYLKHDDGKLTAHIAEKEGWEENDAKNVISKYVREIIAELDQGKSFDMYQFGTFFKNEEGDIDFKNWDQSDSSETPKSEEKAVAVEAPKKEEPKKEVKEVEKIKPEPIIEEPVIKEPTIKRKEKKKSISTPKVASTVIPTEKKEVPKTDKKLDVKEKEEIAKGTEKLKQLKKKKEEKPEKKKKGAGFWLLTVFLVLIVSGSTYIAIDYDNAKQYLPFLAQTDEDGNGHSDEYNQMQEMISGESESSEEEGFEGDTEVTTTDIEENTEPDSSDEEILEESETIEAPVKEVIEPAIESPSISDSNLPYHIIVGAFSSSDNANRLAEKLRNEGNTVKVGPGRGLTLVSVKAFATKDEAQAALGEFENGWIHKWE